MLTVRASTIAYGAALPHTPENVTMATAIPGNCYRVQVAHVETDSLSLSQWTHDGRSCEAVFFQQRCPGSESGACIRLVTLSGPPDWMPAFDFLDH